jgi:pimeloyl-ACP methyl ester carboxylesterase
MKEKIFSILILAAVLAVGAVVIHNKVWKNNMTQQTSKTDSGYVAANGINYYYEITGKGEPLLLLHGGLFSIDMYTQLRDALAQNHRVIAVDLHGHGHTALGNREISLIDQGADMAVLIRSLGYDQVDVVGHSMGGGIAFQFAVQNPDMVRRLVLISTPFAQNGFYPEMLPQQAQLGAGMAEMMKDTQMYKSYMLVAPQPDDFPKLLNQMGAYMRKPYDWSADVAKLVMPVMLIYGDSDMFRPEHIVKFYQLLGGGLKDAGWMREHISKNRLAILPDVTHYDMYVSPQLAPTILSFLDGKSDAANQGER